jgi:hypothetical protein
LQIFFGIGDRRQKPKIKNQKSKAINQKPLTLALSRRERELTVVDVRDTPTRDTESNSGFEHSPNRLPLLRERAGVRGIDSGHHTKPAPTHTSIGAPELNQRNDPPSP